MKNKIVVFLILFALGMALTGCSGLSLNRSEDNHIESGEKKNSYEVFVYDYSDSGTSANPNIEYVFADYEHYNNISAKNNISCSINGKTFTGKYQSSQYREYNYFPAYRYEDENGITFEVDETGLPISFFWGNNTLQGTKKTKDECIEIARNFLADIVDVDGYDISVNENTDRGLYTVKFTKTVFGQKTTDSAEVVVRNDGALYSYSSLMLGRVKEDLFSDYTININKLKEEINGKLYSVYQEVQNKYSRIDYSEPEIILTALKNGEAGAVCYVDINCIENCEDMETVVSDKICFVIVFK